MRESVFRSMRRLARPFIRLWAVRSNVRIGRRVHIGHGSVLWAPHILEVADDVYIGRRCTVRVDGEIGWAVLISDDVALIGRRDHDVWRAGCPARYAPWIGDVASETHPVDSVIVSEDVWIGHGATVLGGVCIGRGAVIAAGSVVTRDVPAYSVYAGNPAREIGRRFSAEEIVAHEAALSAQRRTRQPSA